MIWYHIWSEVWLGVNAFHISIALEKSVMEHENPVLVQEDRKRRFFMLDEIRIAEGEGKVVGGSSKIQNKGV